MRDQSKIIKFKRKSDPEEKLHEPPDHTVDHGRRKALAKLGLFTAIAYAAPVLMTLSEAYGQDSSGSSGSSGSGSGGSGSGGGSGSSGSSGSSGTSSSSGATGASSSSGARGSGGDRGSGSEGGLGRDGQFDFDDFDDLEPMSAEEEAGVVGNWD